MTNGTCPFKRRLELANTASAGEQRPWKNVWVETTRALPMYACMYLSMYVSMYLCNVMQRNAMQRNAMQC